MLVRAYAKINIGLLVNGVRSDGFHDIETIFHRIGLHDDLIFEPAEAGLHFSCSDRSLPTGRDNLCVRAAEIVLDMIESSRGCDRPGVSIHLEKRIPAGAGLGGGSADAAAVLRHLPQFLGFPSREDRLRDAALELGSDVPYFLNDGSAYASGRGDILAYFDAVLPYAVVTVYPNEHISTAWAYGNIAPSRSIESPSLKQLFPRFMLDAGQLRKQLVNDFEAVVFPHFPKVCEVKLRLYELGACFALMSGSGSSVFAFFLDENTASAAVSSFMENYPVFLTEPFFK